MCFTTVASLPAIAAGIVRNYTNPGRNCFSESVSPHVRTRLTQTISCRVLHVQNLKTVIIYFGHDKYGGEDMIMI